MSKNKESGYKKFLALLKRIVGKQTNPKNDIEGFTKFIQETSLPSTKPPAQDQREKDFKNEDGGEANRED